MNIKKLKFYFKDALYSCFFLMVVFSIVYPVCNYLHITERKLTHYDIIWGYIASVFVATTINYLLKDTYEKQLLD